MSQTVINFRYQADAESYFRTTDQVERRLGTLEKAAGSFGKVMQGALAATGFLVVTKGLELVGGAFSGSIGAASTFEKTMSGVKAVSGATAVELGQLSDLALQLGKDTSFSASQAAAGIEELVKGGLTVPDIMNGAAKATLNLAAAGGVDLATAAEIAANALSIFGLKGADMAHVSDQIAGAANASSLSVSDFKFSMAAAGAVAAQSGQSFDDLATAIAVMGSKGLKGSDAGTSLKTFLMNLQPTTKAATKAFEDLGLMTGDVGKAQAYLRSQGIEPLSQSFGGLMDEIGHYQAGVKIGLPLTAKQEEAAQKFAASQGMISNAFIDSQGHFKSMTEIAGILQNATQGLTDAQKLQALETMFGSDAVRAAAIFAGEGATGFDQMAASMGKVTAESVGLERLNNTAGSIEQLKGSLETAGITIGRVFLPYGRKLIDWATGAVNGLIPLLATGGPLLAANLATGGRALLDFGKKTVAILGPVKDAASGLLQAFQTGDFNAAFGPLLAALDAAFGPGTSGKVALFVSQLLRGFQLVRDGFLTAQQALSGKWVGDDTVQPAVRAVGDFALRLRDFALTAKDVFFNQVLPAVQQVAGFIRDHMDTIAKVVAIGAAAFAAFSVISTVVGWVTSAIAMWGVLSVAIEGVGGIIAALVVVLGGPLTLAIAAIVGVVTLLGVAWANNWGDIQGKVAAVWAWLQPVLADLGARLSQFWTDILPQLSAAWESVSTKVVVAATWLWGMLQTVFGAVAGFLVAHGDQIVAVLGGAWALIQNTINTYLGVIGNLVRGVLALISGDWDGAWGYIQQAALIAWNGLVAFFGAAGGLLVQALGAIWGLIRTGASAAWDAISAYVGGKFSDLGAGLRARLDAIARWWSDGWTAVGATVAGVWDGITVYVGGKFSDLGTAIQGKLDDIQAWWRAGWSAVRAYIGDTWDSIVRGVTGALGDLWSGVTGKVADLRAWLNDRWTDIKATALSAWNSMVGQIVQAVVNLGVTILIELAKTETLLLAVFARIARNGLDKATDLYTWVTGKVGDLASWVTDKLGDLRDGAGRIWDSVYTKATGIWASIWKSVTQAAADVRDDVTQSVAAARDSLATLWDSVYTKAAGIWASIWTVVTKSAADLRDDVTSRITTARDSLAILWQSVYDTATAKWDAIRAWLTSTAADMQARITGPIGTAKTLLDTTWDNFSSKATAKWDEVRAYLTITAADMQSKVQKPIDDAKALLDTTWNNLSSKATTKWDEVRAYLAVTAADMQSKVQKPIDDAKALLDTTWDSLSSKATGAWDAIKKHVTDGAEDMKKAILWPFEAGKNGIGAVMASFGNKIIATLNDAGSKVSSFGNGIRDLINWIAGKLGAGKIEENAPGISMKPIPAEGLAKGTRNWGGGMAWVGEGPGGAGAELAYLPRGAQVMTHAESMALVRSGAVAPPQSGPAKLPGFAGGLDALGGIFGVLQKGAGWLYDQAKGAVGLGDLSLPGALGDIGAKMAGKVKDWALGSIDKMLKAATPAPSTAGGYAFPVAGYSGSVAQHWDGWPGSADIFAAEGTSILAMRGGSASSSSDGVGGNTVYISGDDGLDYYYAHMRDPAGVFGKVGTGQQIGLVGRTGNAYKDGTGEYHLHLGVGHGIKSGPEVGSGGGFDFDLIALLNGILDGSIGAPKSTSPFGQGPSAGGTGGNWGDPSIAALDDYIGGGRALSGWGDLIKGDSADRGIPANLAMTIFGHESGYGSSADGLTKYNNFSGLTGSGWDGQTGSTTGMARDFAIFRSKQTGIDAALDNLGYYKGLSLRQTLAKWLTGDPSGARDPEGYTTSDYLAFAEQTIGALGGSYDPDALRFADGGVITEPIVGRGQRSGRSYTFGENGKEAIFNADQLAALSPRSEKGGDTHISNYTIVSSTPEITVDQLKREERREARLRGYGR